MLKRNIILLFALTTVVGALHAQVRPGVKLGYNLSGVKADYAVATEPNLKVAGAPDNFRMKSGFQVGLVADCPINDAFAIQPGVRFTSQGFTDKYTSSGKAIRKFSLYYLQVPVYAQYRLNIAEAANLLIQAGPYAGFGLFGRQQYTMKGTSKDLPDDQKKITFGSDRSDDVRKAFDYGVSAGVGIEFFNFQFVVAYDYGLCKVNFEGQQGSGQYNINMQNNNLSFTLAYIFGHRDPLQNKAD
jgi:hypothetical protein